MSEFEREFELNDFSSEYDGEMNTSEEFEDELENAIEENKITL